jgi:hypothetical protein
VLPPGLSAHPPAGLAGHVAVSLREDGEGVQDPLAGVLHHCRLVNWLAAPAVKAKPSGRPAAGLDSGFLVDDLNPVVKERCPNYMFWFQIEVPPTQVDALALGW